MELNKMTSEQLKQCMISKKITLPNGNVRKFTLLDFYLLSSKEPNAFFKEVENTCNTTELIKIKRFFILPSFDAGLDRVNNLPDKKSLCVEDFINIVYTYKGHQFSDKEKQGIISFLNDYKIPICEDTFFGTAKRYIDGEIDLSKYLKGYQK